MKAWEAESAGLSGEGSRQVAASRREAFAARVGQLRTGLASVKTCYDDFMTRMSDVRILLANDLTADGVVAVLPFVEEAARSSATLDTSIERLSRELEAETSRSATRAPRNPGSPGN